VKKPSGWFGSGRVAGSSSRSSSKGKGVGTGVFVTEEGNIKKKTEHGDTLYIIQDDNRKKGKSQV
jgi:hypothetical protein